MNVYDYIPKNDIYLFNTGNARQAWKCYGCNYIPELNMHRFIVWAPNAAYVSLVGDFNGWDASVTPMYPFEGGIWFCFVPGLKDCDLYKYFIRGADGTEVMKSDPFAAFSQNGVNTASIVWCPGEYEWHDGEYMARRASRNFMKEPMSVYEVHLGSWRSFDLEYVTYRTVADALTAYCKDMGYTHIELMPLTEYPFDDSWGYQVTGYYSPTSRYGNPDDFKYFIDTAHKAGLGVIMDWVPAHFPRDDSGLRRFDGTNLFECKEQRMADHPEWGTLIFDYSVSEVQSFLVSSACKFFDVFHIDGIRVDAVSSMLYLNYARKPGEYTPNKYGGDINLGAVEFLQKLNSTIMINYPGAITIAEESTAYPNVTAPPDNGGLGFCFKWDMGYMHDTLDYMQANPFFRSKMHDKLTFSMMYAFSENFVLAYSHDEVVHGKFSMINKMNGSYEEKFSSLKALYGYQFAHPGKKLTFMGSEFGQFIEWNHKQELDWLLLLYPNHKKLQEYSKALNRLYSETPALYEIDNSWDGFKWLNVNDRERSSVAFLRTGESDKGKYLICVSNFTPVRYDGFVIGLPFPGSIKEILSSDEERFGGTGTVNTGCLKTRNEGFCDLPCSVSLTLPALSTVYFEYHVYKNRH